ncbi:sugar ABC transporter substrate-binding protein [Spirochaeta africana]|uniref:ABC-type sugar transport system, periplasmic component n=1 Tax=Spirochaeta africana (strain ATCC 700263 / DSM 8902 / Z-7692) TaxID=889378 RepID=H9UFT5_SPIAZ|nr:substrate-binding domain-containing protein [Spirochaeta africana]AFG36378.1 ABC-type sugar transport system, periplasmic component [Spirochaeta africana DSM 8902]
MRLSLRVILTVTVLVTAVFAGLLVVSFLRATRQVIAVRPAEGGAEQHITIILPDDSDIFFLALAEGGRQAARQQNAVLEFLYYGAMQDEAGLLLQQARWMQTDGVLVFLPEQNSFTREIGQLAAAGIPVITLINDNPLSGRTAHLGFDAEGIARELVRLMLDDVDRRPQRWGLLIAAEDEGRTAWQAERMEAVIRNLLSGHRQIELLPTRSVAPGYFAGEQEAVRLLREHSEIAGIITAVPQALSGVVQGLIDQNRLGDVRVVGIDTGGGVSEAIQRGLLNGTIYRYPEQVGRSGVELLLQALNDRPVGEYHDLAYTAIDRHNIERFLSRMSDSMQADLQRGGQDG